MRHGKLSHTLRAYDLITMDRAWDASRAEEEMMRTILTPREPSLSLPGRFDTLADIIGHLLVRPQ